MRSNVAEYDLIQPATLAAALETLAADPGRYTPIAGGTELMVALGAGRLAQRHLLSINHLKELRFIDVTTRRVTIGSGATFTDIRSTPSSPATSRCSRRPQVGPAPSPTRTAERWAAIS